MTYLYRIILFIIRLALALAGPMLILQKSRTLGGVVIGILLTLVTFKLLYVYNEPWTAFLADIIAQFISNGDSYFLNKGPAVQAQEPTIKLIDFSKKGVVWVVVGSVACIGLLNGFALFAGFNKLALIALLPAISEEIAEIIAIKITLCNNF